MAFNIRNFLAGFVIMLAATGCSGDKANSEEAQSAENTDVKAAAAEVDEDGEWRLASYRDGHETKVYGKDVVSYVLSFYDDKSFDFYVNNDTVEGEYKVVNDTIRFYSVEEAEANDQILKILSESGCYACQENDTLIVTISDSSEAVFTRVKE